MMAEAALFKHIAGPERAAECQGTRGSLGRNVRVPDAEIGCARFQGMHHSVRCPGVT